jgi:hypothetical protein
MFDKILISEKSLAVANPCPIMNTVNTPTAIVWTWTNTRRTGEEKTFEFKQ